MELKNFLKFKGRKYRRALSEWLGISNFYLGQLALGRRRPSESLAVSIEHATSGEVRLSDLRPDFADQLAVAGYVLHPELRQEARACEVISARENVESSDADNTKTSKQKAA